ncbi:CvfD/Ygs/GSP13 family RNA-binding post-transcriptional regulator [Agrilactobacillus yilanensis]|uniref:CvfD/Ygs/GSP13 family RNA-binding post-transcriptional regulator n=1 Tax=Agrilactobacillus yilanensis TaxID=2485997 RepID=A0ABW4J7W1_9LACO|nr:CvfD/Ygs/GSP13 family RNA-binding post-transcriptional regulator [Agrilactobacillus yilanensis]
MGFKIGDIVEGTVTGIQNYGVFVLLSDAQQGLIHISECEHGFVKNVNELFKVGQKVKVMVLDIDEYSKKISLSVRILNSDPNVTDKWHRKHYWTNRHLDYGYKPIGENMVGWLAQAEKDFGVPDIS